MQHLVHSGDTPVGLDSVREDGQLPKVKGVGRVLAPG